MINIFKVEMATSQYALNVRVTVLVPEYFLMTSEYEIVTDKHYPDMILVNDVKLPTFGSEYYACSEEEYRAILNSVKTVNELFQDKEITIKYNEYNDEGEIEHKIEYIKLRTNREVQYAYKKGGRLNNNGLYRGKYIGCVKSDNAIYVYNLDKYRTLAKRFKLDFLYNMKSDYIIIAEDTRYDILQLYKEVNQLNEYIENLTCVYTVSNIGITCVLDPEPNIDYFLTIDEAREWYQIAYGNSISYDELRGMLNTTKHSEWVESNEEKMVMDAYAKRDAKMYADIANIYNKEVVHYPDEIGTIQVMSKKDAAEFKLRNKDKGC